MRDLTVSFCFKTKSVTFSRWLQGILAKGDVFPRELARRLEIQADSDGEAIDFVKQILIDIAAEDSGINPDVARKSFRERFGGSHA
ncbi:hypothetical protein LU604_14770 [Erwinia tracheiphila]|uniref:Uncharacterized protein n=1 Tax=Erwinia tracheiphila TaxID=65700 RepID=A0A345CQ09_9GAMM|nr:hypothetical protein [Erwinia tracheiphila]AXF75526.1 hypothetical protein AV903_04445 [Erwinia tracheiphila]UIA81929.1 hypothetical protein LU604_14770 [Erwinia tracheiphila]UIA90525.1 hypothetical protein LU632_14345 [Erwinia tracheiphila]